MNREIKEVKNERHKEFIHSIFGIGIDLFRGVRIDRDDHFGHLGGRFADSIFHHRKGHRHRASDTSGACPQNGEGQMTNTKLIYAAAVAAGILIAIFGVKTFIGEMRIRRLESDIAKQEATAKTLAETAAAKEAEARRYVEKIAYLETKLTEINDIARRQNEEIEKAETVVRDARDNVHRVRGIRSIAVTADELCRKLAEAGHPCE